MHLSGKYLNEVSFPVGGIGAGCIGINGQGRLSDWEILNKGGKKHSNGCSHFAVRAESKGKIRDVRILNGPLTQGLMGEPQFNKYGFGPDADTFCGFPYFEHVEMDGAFPVAEYYFEDEHFPGKAELRAWSPFIPGDSDTSSLPCAVFEITLENTTDEPLEYTCVGVLSDLWREEGAANSIKQKNKLTSLEIKNLAPTDSCAYGEVALTTDAKRVSYQEYFYRGVWADHREVYAHDLFTPGPFKNRSYPPRTTPSMNHGLLATHLYLKPGQRDTVRYIISWYVPNRQNTWEDPKLLAERMEKDGVKCNQWKNYYATICKSAVDAAAKIFQRYAKIRQEVFTFRDAIHSSTLPHAVLDGAAENLAVLISPVCLRLEDGTFWGWEGMKTEMGSCYGSCQHVWNYAQALSLLFPDLERTLRESMLKYNLMPNNTYYYRLALPLGLRPVCDFTAADGALGEIMKCYREWKISGDTQWMKKIYPQVKRIMLYAWDPNSFNRWDPTRSGVMTGRQAQTLDMEFFGPSGWLQSHYLGALVALSRMAEACGEKEFAAECMEVYQKGREYTERELFNGEYYIEKIDLEDISLLKPYLKEGEKAEENCYWDAEHNEIKYQQGEGCSIDSHLGQWYASLYGLGEILSPTQIRKNLQSIYKYNFRKDLSQFVNTWRVFSLGHESGTIICTWPDHVRKPVIPLSYNSETMTGFEWAVACHSIMAGEIRHGEEMAAAIRGRFNGYNRNPWNEFECGSNYARSMAAFGMLQAYSGFSYDMTEGCIGFAPIKKGDFRCFWSLGTVWGTYERKGEKQTIQILYGKANFQKLCVTAKSLQLNGQEVLYVQDNDTFCGFFPVKAGDCLEFV